MTRYILLILAALGFCSLRAQEQEYMYEIGPGIGASWAYGDVNRNSVLYDPALSADFLFRYNFNLRWAMAVDVSHHRVKGDSQDFDNALPLGQTWQFDRRLWQLSLRLEIDFWNYGWGADYREKHRLAPFLTAGFGIGAVSGETTGQERTTALISLPVGLGLKWKMAPRWDLNLTALWSKTFGDDLDGYIDPYKTGSKSPVNTDWMGSVMLNITFNFKERCFECHNQDN